MASPNFSVDPSMAINDNSSNIIVNTTLNPTAPFFFPQNPCLHQYYFSPPPVYFFSGTNLPPPSSIFVYYPLWYTNPNPNPNPVWYGTTQELQPLHSLNPSQELPRPPTSRERGFVWRRSNGRRKKVMWRRRIQYQADHSTTVMLRNIPNKYTRELMIEFLDEHCGAENKEEDEENPIISAYDFLYLPIDFQSNMNKGYAFVNFTKAEAVSKFKAACNYMPWRHFSSRKILEIANARIQGKDELVKHFDRMTYPVEEYSAVCFSPARTGPKKAVQTIMVGTCTQAVVSV